MHFLDHSKIKLIIIIKTMSYRLSWKIDDKKGAKALFSRSHLNIRSIDLFCVTYPDPFFVIKEEENCGEGINLSPVCVGVFLCI